MILRRLAAILFLIVHFLTWTVLMELTSGWQELANSSSSPCSPSRLCAARGRKRRRSLVEDGSETAKRTNTK
jgi:hypothetical protein